MTQDIGHTSNAGAVRHAARAKLEALGQERSARRKSIEANGKRDLLQHLSRLTGTPLTSAPVQVSTGVIDAPPASIKPANTQISDLFNLPGAGPGLIWMLNSLDIHRLSDIAEMKAETLRHQLGSIGAVLDVQSWIDFAKAAQHTENTAPLEQVI